MRYLPFFLLAMIVFFVGAVIAQNDDFVTQPDVILGGIGRISDVEWSPDGETLAVSADVGIVFFDRFLKETARLEIASTVEVGADIEWSPGGSLLAVGTGLRWQQGRYVYSDEAYIWDAASVEIAHVLTLDEGVHMRYVRWNHSGTAVLASLENRDGLLQALVLWDAATGEQVVHELMNESILGHTSWRWSSDDRLLFGRDGYEDIVLVAETGRIAYRADVNDHSLVETSPDGEYTARALGGIVTVMDGDGDAFELRGDEIGRFRGFRNVAWSPNSSMIAVWGIRGSAGLIAADLETGDHLLELDSEWSTGFQEVTFNGQGDRLAVVNERGDLFMYDMPYGALVDERWLRTSATSMSFSPDGTRIVTARARAPIFIWDAEIGEPITSLLPPYNEDMPWNNVYSVAYSPNGEYIATGSQRTIPLDEGPLFPIDFYIWDANTGAIVQSVPAVGVHGDWIYRIDWSADSDVLAFSSISNESARSHVGIWDVTVEEMLYQVHQPSPIFDIALHPDGQFLAVPGIRDGEDWATNPTVPPAVYLVDADAGAFVEEALFEVDHFSISLDWHPDGEYLAEWRLSFIEDERIVAVNIWRWDGDGRAEQVFSFTPAGDYHRTLIEWNAAGDALAMGYFDLEGRVGGVQVWQVSFDPMNAELESVYITEYDEWDELRFGPTVAPWSADGSRLAASVSTREIVVWER